MRPSNLFSIVASFSLLASAPCLAETPEQPEGDVIQHDLGDGGGPGFDLGDNGYDLGTDSGVRPRPRPYGNGRLPLWNGRAINHPFVEQDAARPGNPLGNTRALNDGDEPFAGLDVSRDPKLGANQRPGLGDTRAIDAPGGDPVPGLDMSREPDLGNGQRPGLGNTQRSTDGAEPELDAADLNADGRVTVVDLVEMILAWGTCGRHDPVFGTDQPCPADLNSDGYVDVEDLVNMILNWN
jgi:hypothetical protein